MILEVLENETPVIARDKFGARNILNEANATLYRFDGGDSADTLAYAIIKAVGLWDCFDRRVVAATAEPFTFARKVEQYMQIYRELTGDRI